jgi:hypothetical protein
MNAAPLKSLLSLFTCSFFSAFFWKIFIFDSLHVTYFQTLINPRFALPVLMLSHWPPYHCVVTFINSHNSSGRPKAAPAIAGEQSTSSRKTMLYLSVLYFFHSVFALSHHMCLLQCSQWNYKHFCVPIVQVSSYQKHHTMFQNIFLPLKLFVSWRTWKGKLVLAWIFSFVQNSLLIANYQNTGLPLNHLLIQNNKLHK